MKNFGRCFNCFKDKRVNKTHCEKIADNPKISSADPMEIDFIIENESLDIRLETERNESFIDSILEIYEVNSNN